MPVSKLLVEGKLDHEILTWILGGDPLVIAVNASKHALVPRTRTEQESGSSDVRYLRDRDFDFTPPENSGHPECDREGLGWRWCRTMIENYMLEPAIVSAALRIDPGPYRSALSDAAKEIRFYQAARWAIGIARSKLPHFYQLTTYISSDDFELPDAGNLGRVAIEQWVISHVASFAELVVPCLKKETVQESFVQHVTRFDDSFLNSTEYILVYFSGKDLMAALRPWLAGFSIKTPGDFRSILRDWMREHPDETLAFLAEWNAFLTTLRQ